MSSNLQSRDEQQQSDFSLITRTPILNDGDPEAKRQEILKYFHNSFTLYESIFECLTSDEAFFARANPLRHPLIFYYGHTSVFFINKLNVANLIDERVDPQIESTLAIGVDEMSWDDLNEAHYNWPTPAAVKQHRDKTRQIVDRFIRECDCSMPIDWNSPLWIVLMGIEHERIHLETTSMLIRELPLEMVKPHPVWSDICRETGSAPDNQLIAVEGGKVEMGKSRTNPLYGWDNEYGYAAEEVNSFARFQIPGLQPGVLGVHRRRRLPKRILVERRRLGLGHLSQRRATGLLAKRRRPLSVSYDAGTDRHAMGLAR